MKNASKNSKRNHKSSLHTSLQHHLEHQFNALSAGVGAFLKHGRYTPPKPQKTIWKQGSGKLYDYGAASKKAPIILLVPSLINRFYILDLLPNRSLVSYLKEKGFRVLLLDWSEPEEGEQHFDVNDYIKRLKDAVLFAKGYYKQRPSLVGYCMGGMMSLAVALQLGKKHLKGLVLLATPWDFHSKDVEQFKLDAPAKKSLVSYIKKQPFLNSSFFYYLFYLQDPWQVHRKFSYFSTLSPQSVEAKIFIAKEYWLNDGVPVTQNVAKTCLVDWAMENVPMNNLWKVAGNIVKPEYMEIPTFIAIPEQDVIVPPGCAAPLSVLIPDNVTVNCKGGHLGMIAGRNASISLWQPLAKWLSKL